jgi:hypothetical protein
MNIEQSTLLIRLKKLKKGEKNETKKRKETVSR